MDVPVKSDGLIEFLASIQTVNAEDTNGYMTTEEIRCRLGISEKKVRSMLRELINSGKVAHRHVNIRSIDGRTVKSNGYRLITD